MNTNTQMETPMNDQQIAVPEFGYDTDPASVARLHRTIDRQSSEIAAVRRAAQQQRMRADTAEAKLAALRDEGAGR